MHIGVNKVNNNAYSLNGLIDPPANLQGAVIDAHAMWRMACALGYEHIGFSGADPCTLPTSNTPALLVDEGATSAALFRVIDQIIEQVRIGDQVLITFSGHGSLLPRSVCPSTPGAPYQQAHVWCLHDTPLIETELTARFQCMPGVKVIVVADCCEAGQYSGELWRDLLVKFASFRDIAFRSLASSESLTRFLAEIQDAEGHGLISTSQERQMPVLQLFAAFLDKGGAQFLDRALCAIPPCSDASQRSQTVYYRLASCLPTQRAGEDKDVGGYFTFELSKIIADPSNNKQSIFEIVEPIGLEITPQTPNCVQMGCKDEWITSGPAFRIQYR